MKTIPSGRIQQDNIPEKESNTLTTPIINLPTMAADSSSLIIHQSSFPSSPSTFNTTSHQNTEENSSPSSSSQYPTTTQQHKDELAAHKLVKPEKNDPQQQITDCAQIISSSVTTTAVLEDERQKPLIVFKGDEKQQETIEIPNLDLPQSPSGLSVSSSASSIGEIGLSTTTIGTRPLSALLNNTVTSTTIWWKERLFPRELLPTSASATRTSSSATNFNLGLDNEIIATCSISSSRLEAVVETSSSDGEFSEQALLEHSSKELCSNMTEEELEQISTPSAIDLIREMKFGKHKSSLIHLAAKHNRVELLHWFKRCCCDNKCSCKHIPISKLLNSQREDKSTTITEPSPFALFETKRFSRNFGKNFNVAIRHFDSDDGTSSQHSKQCLFRQESLWTTIDQYSATPLFYSCKNHLAMEATAFLLSQPIVSQKQLNHHHDQFGNLPITIGFRSGNFRLCDLLVLFGAKIDVTSGVLAESLLHKVCRDGGDLEVIRYLSRNSPKVLLKRNQRDENPLFACIRDLRVASIPPNGGSFSSDSHFFMHRKSSNGVSDTSFTLLHNILSYGSELFGKEIFEKAILMKNSFGMNILMTSIMYNDVDAMKVICLAFSNYCSPTRSTTGSKRTDLNISQLSDSSNNTSEGTSPEDAAQLTSPRKRSSLRLRIHQRILSMDKREGTLKNMLKTMIFDKDKQGKTILHLMIEAAIQLEENGGTCDDLTNWFDGFQWLCLWLEQNFLQSLNNRTNGEWTADCGVCNFFEARDLQGYSPYGMVVAKQPNEELNFIEQDSTDDMSLFWPRVLEFIHTTIKKWSTCANIKVSPESQSNTRDRGDFRYNAELRGSRGLFQSDSDSLDSINPEREDSILVKMKRRFKRTQSVDLDK